MLLSLVPPSAPVLYRCCSAPVFPDLSPTAVALASRQKVDSRDGDRWGVPQIEESCAVSVVEMDVPGMTCRHCVRAVTARLRDLPGVIAVEADAVTARLVVHGDVTAAEVTAALADVPLTDRHAAHQQRP
ncbi:hypothetical protein GCM10027446_01210 [Angustibacter peucedani]